MYGLIILTAAILTALLPIWIKYVEKLFPTLKLNPSYGWLPLLASLLFISAFYIPNIHISSETTTFQQHFVGGGMYVAFLYLYFKKLFGWHFNWALSLLILFAWTSAFGVASELLEFTLTKLHITNIGIGDTDWDLLANTSGAFAGYLMLRMLRIERNE